MKNRILHIIVCLLAFPVWAQVYTQLSPDRILIGDTASLQIEFKTPSDAKVELPMLGDSLGKYLEIVNKKIDSVREGNQKKYKQIITLTGFEEGNFLVKSLPYVINGKTVLSDTRELGVEMPAIDTTLQKMYPIKTIMPEHISWWDRNKKYLWYMIVGGIMLIALLIVAFLYLKELRRKRYISTPLLPPYEEALQNLKKLDALGLLEKQEFNQYYTDLSFIVRRYFSRRFEFPAQALLSTDLPEYMKNKEFLTQEESAELYNFLTDADRVKYAKATLSPEKNAFYRDWAEKIIEKTKPLVEEVKDHI
ncbi:DUF4381 family protein [Ornithobacterium rhinotracheale]|uniref:DUF4381 family protein n=2 Tax=Ornithobacterium rhinotracheale TaxID=28251 RepID=UPI00215953BC|nr:DUF4381 family protein [Ornithobacterium rhinotracheale]UVD88203.1 DUF4381 family protein [Ornithobacterium rhinotracheale]